MNHSITLTQLFTRTNWSLPQDGVLNRITRNLLRLDTCFSFLVSTLCLSHPLYSAPDWVLVANGVFLFTIPFIPVNVSTLSILVSSSANYYLGQYRFFYFLPISFFASLVLSIFFQVDKPAEKKPPEEPKNVPPERPKTLAEPHKLSLRESPLKKVKKSPRTLLAEELRKTEETYVECLNILIDVFMAEFEKATNQRNPPITPDQCKVIFSSLVVIKGFNNVLLSDLNQRLSEWDDASTLLGDIFLQLGDYLKVYNTYCVNYAFALKTLSICDKNPGFMELLQKCESNPRVNHQPFVSLLVTPIQRLPRYLMLLNRLHEETSNTHPDHQNLEKASRQMAAITGRVNEDLRSATEMNRIYRLQEKLECEFQLIAPARFLVKEQRRIKNLLPSGKLENCDVFLFNDLIILVGAPSRSAVHDLVSTMAPRLRLKNHCEFEHAVVSIGADDRILITNTQTPNLITLQFPSTEIRDEWFQLISLHVNTTKEKAAFLLNAQRSAKSSDANRTPTKSEKKQEPVSISPSSPIKETKQPNFSS